MADEYMFTFSTGDFYEKTNGKIKRMEQAPKPKEFARQVIENAPNWVKKFGMPSKERYTPKKCIDCGKLAYQLYGHGRCSKCRDKYLEELNKLGNGIDSYSNRHPELIRR